MIAIAKVQIPKKRCAYSALAVRSIRWKRCAFFSAHIPEKRNVSSALPERQSRLKLNTQ